MTNILDIIDAILGTSNTFCGILPETPDALTALFEYQGAPPQQFFDATALSYNVQVRTRAKRADEAYTRALDAQNKLNRYVSDTFVIRQVSSIIDIGQDTKNRKEYTVNFRIDMKE